MRLSARPLSRRPIRLSCAATGEQSGGKSGIRDSSHRGSSRLRWTPEGLVRETPRYAAL